MKIGNKEIKIGDILTDFFGIIQVTSLTGKDNSHFSAKVIDSDYYVDINDTSSEHTWRKNYNWKYIQGYNTPLYKLLFRDLK